MTFMIRRRASSSATASSSSERDRLADGPASSPAAAIAIAAPDHHGGAQNGGSKDELFFETRPWLDSDSEDDFYSMRGDFTPSRGSTPDHPIHTCSGAWMSADGRSEHSLMDKKQRLLELLQQKQLFEEDDDDEQDGATDVGAEAGMNGIVHAEEHLEMSCGKAEKPKRSPKEGCFPRPIWRLRFKGCCRS